MLASVSCVIKEGMCGQLEPVVGRILQALSSEEGVTVSRDRTLPALFLSFFSHFPLPLLSTSSLLVHLQVHYASSEVPFLDFDEEEEEEGEGGERGEASSSMLDDSRAIEGWVWLPANDVY